MIINTTKQTLFYDWLTWLNPLIPLTEQEKRVLAANLTLHYHYTLQEYNTDTLNNVLFSSDVQIAIAKKLGFQINTYDTIKDSLVQKGLISKTEINPKLTQYPKDNKFSLNLDFNIQDLK